MNTAIYEALVTTYRARAYAHRYIFGYAYKGTIYASYTDASALAYVTKLDRASRGAGYALRFKPDTMQKLYLLAGKTEVICSTEKFDEIVKSSKYNRGEVFEKIITERFGQKWAKDHIPFDKGADLTVNGVDYQIKFEKATFTNEKILLHRA